MRTLTNGRNALMAGAIAALAASQGAAEPARYEVDPAHVVVAFMVEHLGFARVLGTFTEIEGSFFFDEQTGAVSDVEVTVAAGSVSTHHEARDEHIRGDDFLDARTFPEIRFTAASARRLSDRTFAIDGELTLLGITRPLTLEATWNKSGDYPIGRDAYAIGVSARGTLDRGDYGMSYAIDNGWVGNEVEILVEFEAQRE